MIRYIQYLIKHVHIFFPATHAKGQFVANIYLEWWNDTSFNEMNGAPHIISNGSISPFKCQLRTDFDLVKEFSKISIKRKGKSAVHGVLNSIVPGQEYKLLRLIQLDNTEDGENAKPYTYMVDLIVKLFPESSSSLTRRQLLSIIGVKFTKKELQEWIPGLTTYCISSYINLHWYCLLWNISDGYSQGTALITIIIVLSQYLFKFDCLRVVSQKRHFQRMTQDSLPQTTHRRGTRYRGKQRTRENKKYANPGDNLTNLFDDYWEKKQMSQRSVLWW